MILADTSAWVEYLRATGSRTDLLLEGIIREGGSLITTEVVVMELLAGAADPAEWQRLRALLHGFPLHPLEGLASYEAAADLYRTCRQAGETPRRLVDCLIAEVAIRTGASLLHQDSDFDLIARHAPLAMYELEG